MSSLDNPLEHDSRKQSSISISHTTSTSTSTSRSLLDRLKADEADAWDRLIGLYAPLLLRWCRRWHVPEQDLSDIFQDVFQAVATHIGGFRKQREGESFRAWLRTIAYHKVCDHFRKAEREPGGAGGTEAQLRFSRLAAAEASDQDDGGEENAERGLLTRALNLIRCEFEDRTWQAFWLTVVEGKSPQELAVDLGMSPGAIRVAKARVLRRLRDELLE
jgi:RNA polymerase sigma-70 factor (ECF subfamily)